MSQNSFLLYGANGYTGQLIARFAHQYGLKPILAGRNEDAIKSLAAELNLQYRIFDLNNTPALHAALKEVKLVLHAAGPFKHTAKAIIEACLLTARHYLDITGEIAVFEMAKQLDAAAKEKGVMLMPGTGFDVVPTDCIALHLKKILPDADELQIAFASVGGGLSHGTATTMAENLGGKSAVRKNGKIVPVALGHKGMQVDFGEKKLFTMTIPWGDISTAYTTTGIPNIETYTGIKEKTFKLLKYQWLFNWLLRTSFFRNTYKRKINKKPAGPSDENRAKAKSLVWAKVKNKNNVSKEARIVCPDGYTLTAHSSLIITRKVLELNFKTGYQTPAGCYGPDLILEVPNTKRETL
jgi:short subunit dehydrogenase-like uncharacterized protein